MRWPLGAVPGDGKSCLSLTGGASLSLGLRSSPAGGAWREPRLRVGELPVGEEVEGAASTAVVMVGSTCLDMSDIVMFVGGMLLFLKSIWQGLEMEE